MLIRGYTSRVVGCVSLLTVGIMVCTAASSLGSPPLAAVLTQRYNNQRTGANLEEHVLTVASVSSLDFQKLYEIPVDGQAYAQPLLVPQVAWPDGTAKNVLIIATMTNSIYAFQVDDAFNGAFPPVPLWKTTLGGSVAANFEPLSYSSYICELSVACFPFDKPPLYPVPLPPIGMRGDDIIANNFGLYNINPVFGIVSTPVIDRASGTIFVVREFSTNTSPPIEAELIALSIVTGQVLRRTQIGGAAQVPGSSSDSKNGMLHFDPVQQMQRPALLLQNGQLYIGFGSRQDTLPFHGWIFTYDASTFEPIAVWCSTPNAMGASVWQAGGGIAGDDNGNIYVMTGNGDPDPYTYDTVTREVTGTNDDAQDVSHSNFANTFVQLNSALAPMGAYPVTSPTNADANDVDLGSAGPVLLPGAGVVIGAGKEGRLFVLDESTHLGMRQAFQVSHPPEWIVRIVNPPLVPFYHHVHGSPAVWRSSNQGMTIFTWPERDYLKAFKWDDNAGLFTCSRDPLGCNDPKAQTATPDQQSSFSSPTCANCMPGAIVSISAEGDSAGTGVLWASMPEDTGSTDHVLAVGGAQQYSSGSITRTRCK